MRPRLTKSLFMAYIDCPASFWLEAHEPDLTPAPDVIGELAIQDGMEVDGLATRLFPQVVQVRQDLTNEARAEATRDIMASTMEAIAQPTFIVDDMLVRCDFIQWDEANGGWALYEAKATSSVKPEHYTDLAFQQVVLEACGLKVTQSHVIHLDKRYRRDGDVVASDLLTFTDVTAEVEVTLPVVRSQAAAALSLLATPPLPNGMPDAACECWRRGKNDHCTHFSRFHPQIPSFSSFDVRVLGKTKDEYYHRCFTEAMFRPDQVSDDVLSLAGKKSEELLLQRTSGPQFDPGEVREELQQLTYPLYFLDYETAKWAMPRYDRTGPYQQIPFQYSLHVMNEEPSSNAELVHHEFLWTERTDPIPHLARQIMGEIGPVGSVIVWNKSFEMTRNKEMGAHYPPSAEFFADVNARVYDLMDVFRKRLYRDPAFKGSASIKNVLPVMVPEMSYEHLTVSNGGDAMSLWPQAVFGVMPDWRRAAVFEGLLEYCGQDTLAMVRIFEVLHKLAE